MKLGNVSKTAINSQNVLTSPKPPPSSMKFRAHGTVAIIFGETVRPGTSVQRREGKRAKENKQNERVKDMRNV